MSAVSLLFLLLKYKFDIKLCFYEKCGLWIIYILDENYSISQYNLMGLLYIQFCEVGLAVHIFTITHLCVCVPQERG